VKKPLTDKQQAFCNEYIIDNNATQALIRAGYSEKGAKTAGCRLLANVNIAKEIKRLKSLTETKHHITKTELVEKTVSILQNMTSETNKENTRAAGVALKAVDTLCKMLGYFETVEEANKNIVALQINVKTKNDE
jgi:phage terminase small subunit